MAYLSLPWTIPSPRYRYITRDVLLAILQQLPTDCILMTNQVGNLSVMTGVTPNGDQYTEQLGYIDIGAEEYVRV